MTRSKGTRNFEHVLHQLQLLRSGSLANPKLRKALSCAYNSQAYCDIFRNGVAPVANQLVPPGIFGHLKDWTNPNAYNPERAKQLIAEAGYPNGIDPKTGQPLELTMDVTATGSEERQTAEFEQRQFEALGIRIKVIENTFAKALEKQEARTIPDRAEHRLGRGLSRSGKFLLPLRTARRTSPPPARTSRAT